jgi:hypothetical protein
VIRSLGVEPARKGATSSHFDLVSHWRIHAGVEDVWDALIDTASWPRWWPYARSVQALREGGADGVGAVRRIEWSTPWPYRFVLEVEAVELLRHQRLRGRARGALDGQGLWLLRSADGITDLTYVWRVELGKTWLRWLAPLLAPVFRWNHEVVMRAGEQGLRRYLSTRRNRSVV